MELITGILLGLSTLLFIGPVFFYLVKTTLEGGIWAGVSVAIGVVVGDIIYVFLAVEGLSSFLDNDRHNKWFALFGGILLLFLGLKYIFTQIVGTRFLKSISTNSLGIYALKGFLLNFVNPFVLAVWIGFYSINQTKFESKSAIILSLIVTLIVIFTTDCLKAVFAHKLKPYLKSNKLRLLYKLFGIIMILFGIRLLMHYLITV
jgi:threonine/homoserine/homoserine lactone efflux protein